jgi:hypothetical protein
VLLGEIDPENEENMKLEKIEPEEFIALPAGKNYIDLCVYVYMYVYMYACIYICMCVYMYVCINTCICIYI